MHTNAYQRNGKSLLMNESGRWNGSGRESWGRIILNKNGGQKLDIAQNEGCSGSPTEYDHELFFVNKLVRI